MSPLRIHWLTRMRPYTMTGSPLSRQFAAFAPRLRNAVTLRKLVPASSYCPVEGFWRRTVDATRKEAKGTPPRVIRASGLATSRPDTVTYISFIWFPPRRVDLLDEMRLP